MKPRQSEIREAVAKCLYEAVLIVAGGSFQIDIERKKLRETALSSVSFPNKKSESPGGKPQDVEIRLALSLFHRLKRTSQSGEINLVSEMGLLRSVNSAKMLAELLLEPLESACQREGIAHDVRLQPSGLICIVTKERSQFLRLSGKLPCPLCTKWCQGEKGLWWHQQQNHNVEYSEATETAASSVDTLAIIPFDSNTNLTYRPVPSKTCADSEEPLEYIKTGDIVALRRAIQAGYEPVADIDRKGASPLMWAAGGGHLDILRLLVEECGCEPNQSQRGKRSFSGRTALHWASRNGHLEVARFLVEDCKVNMEASTLDGTTAFGWASWQGHLDIMEFLERHGCDIHCVNSFGCNAVLWAAQGKGDTRIMDWLKSRGCEMTRINNNGHGVLHKAAQRGHDPICIWFFEKYIRPPAPSSLNIFDLIRPDADGYCPSDLAGLEGHEKLARKLAQIELDLVVIGPPRSIPEWLSKHIGTHFHNLSAKEIFVWERFGGLRRMCWALHHKEKAGS